MALSIARTRSTIVAAMMVSLLLLHRQRPDLVELIRMKVGWSVRYRRERLGELAQVVDPAMGVLGMGTWAAWRGFLISAGSWNA